MSFIEQGMSPEDKEFFAKNPKHLIFRAMREDTDEKRELRAHLEGLSSRPELTPEERSEQHSHLKEEVMNVLSVLEPRERQVLELRFGLEDGRSRTQVETGREIQRSDRTVRRIEKKAMSKLRATNATRLKDLI